jgi:hypothetical protein
MARKKKGAGKVKAVAVTLEDLTDEEAQLLLEQHKDSYEDALAAKKKAAAEFLNVCKKAKADLGAKAVEMIKDAIDLDTPEGEARFKADLERKLKVAKWIGSDALAGTQFEMFADSGKDSVRRAEDEGLRNGRSGKALKTDYAPGTREYDAFVDAHHRGAQDRVRIQRMQDDREFDDTDRAAPIGAAAPTFQAH